jgi:hypothetical protein
MGEENVTPHNQIFKIIEKNSIEIEEFSKKIQTQLNEIKKIVYDAQEEIFWLKKQKNEVYGMYTDLKKKRPNEDFIVKYDTIQPMKIYGIGLRSFLEKKDYRNLILNYLNRQDILNLKSSLTGKKYIIIKDICCICGITDKKNYQCASCGNYMCATTGSTCIKRILIKGAGKIMSFKEDNGLLNLISLNPENSQERLCIKCYNQLDYKNIDLNYKYSVIHLKYGKCRSHYENNKGNKNS